MSREKVVVDTNVFISAALKAEGTSINPTDLISIVSS